MQTCTRLVHREIKKYSFINEKAFSDPFMLSEKRAYKKRQDEMLIALDEAECGDYDRGKAKKEGDEYY